MFGVDILMHGQAITSGRFSSTAVLTLTLTLTSEMLILVQKLTNITNIKNQTCTC